MNENQFKALLSDNELMIELVAEMRMKIETILLGFLVSLSLTSILVALKLDAVISWNWIWILAPAWLSMAIVVIIIAAFYVKQEEQIKRMSALRLSNIYELLQK